MPKVHLCIECRRDPPPTVRKLWSGLREGDPPRCGEHGRAWDTRRKRQAWASRIRRFGIEPELYWAVYEAQGGRCAIRGCAATGKTKMLAIDHDHDYAKAHCDHDPKKQACPACFRGLACGPHNLYLLGYFRNSLQAGLDYLADPPARAILARLAG